MEEDEEQDEELKIEEEFPGKRISTGGNAAAAAAVDVDVDWI